MKRATTYRVACLSGNGIGPEVMAEASRALARLANLHAFRIQETHPLFGGEAFTQSGHALPAATRRATLAAHAILVAGADEPALAGVGSELDLGARIDRVVFAPRNSVTVLSPAHADADADAEWMFSRAFDVACSSRARITSVGADPAWETAFFAEAARHPGVLVDTLPFGAAFEGLAFEPDRFDVVVAPTHYAEPIAHVAAHGRRARVTASGHLARTGPGIFVARHGPADEIAGQGVANPTSMLLATALMLGEGLGERAAASTLAGAVLDACCNGLQTPDMVATGRGATTREFADVVLAALPSAMTNAEFYREAFA